MSRDQISLNFLEAAEQNKAESEQTANQAPERANPESCLIHRDQIKLLNEVFGRVVKTTSSPEFVESIRKQGLIEPVLLRRCSSPPYKYELVAGYRRIAALQELGINEVPAIVRDIDDTTSLALSLIENLHRQNPNPLDLGR